MLRLAPNGYYRFFQNDQMQATFGGGVSGISTILYYIMGIPASVSLEDFLWLAEKINCVVEMSEILHIRSSI